MSHVPVVGFTFGVFAAVGVITAGLGSWYTVDQGERAVVTRAGAVIGTAGPGFHGKMPLLDDVTTINTQTLITTLDNLNAYSRDQQPADMRVSVNWRAVESGVERLYAEFGSLQAVQDRLLVPRINQQTKVVFGQFSAVAAIQERARLNAEVMEALTAAGEGLIIVEGVQIENIDFSDAYEQSIEARMLAEVEVAKLRQNAEREKVQADIKITQANASAAATRAQAEADAYAVQVRGDAEAASIRARGAALGDSPRLVELITAERWNGTLPTTMMPGGAVPFISVR